MDLISREKAAGIFISSHLLATLNEDHESASFSISVDKKEQRANSYIFRCVVDSKFGFHDDENKENEKDETTIDTFIRNVLESMSEPHNTTTPVYVEYADMVCVRFERFLAQKKTFSRSKGDIVVNTCVLPSSMGMSDLSERIYLHQSPNVVEISLFIDVCTREYTSVSSNLCPDDKQTGESRLRDGKYPFVQGVLDGTRGFLLSKLLCRCRLKWNEDSSISVGDGTHLKVLTKDWNDIPQNESIYLLNYDGMSGANNFHNVRSAIQGMTHSSVIKSLKRLGRPYSSRGYCINGLLYDFKANSDQVREAYGASRMNALHVLLINGIVVPTSATEIASLLRHVDTLARKTLCNTCSKGKLESHFTHHMCSFVLYVSLNRACDKTPVGLCSTVSSSGDKSSHPIFSNSWRNIVDDWDSLTSCILDCIAYEWGISPTRKSLGTGRNILSNSSILGKRKDLTRTRVIQNENKDFPNQNYQFRSPRSTGFPHNRNSGIYSLLDRFGWRNRKLNFADSADDMTQSSFPTKYSQYSLKAQRPDLQANVLCESSAIDIHLYSGYSKSLQPKSLSRTNLEQVRLLGQVDNKFILAVTSSDILTIFDQHAADERVRLEELHNVVFGSFNANRSNYSRNNKGNTSHFPRASVLNAIHVTLSPVELNALEQFSWQINFWGWEWKKTSPLRLGLARPIEYTESSNTEIVITHVPLLMSDMKVLGVDPFRNYIMEVADLGGCLRPPSTFLSLLNSRSCRSAIMFGDYLSRNKMLEVITSLSKCALPFMCAHQRPTVAPAISIKAMEHLLSTLRIQSNDDVIIHANGKNSNYSDIQGKIRRMRKIVTEISNTAESPTYCPL